MKSLVAALLLATSCATVVRAPQPQIPVTIRATHQIFSRGDISYLIDVEYRIPNGPLIHDQVLVDSFLFVAYTSHEVCAEKRYAGYALVRCN